MRHGLLLTFNEAEFLAMMLDKQIEMFSTIHQPGRVNDFIAVTEFLTGNNLTRAEAEESTDQEVIDHFRDAVLTMKMIRNRIKAEYGI